MTPASTGSVGQATPRDTESLIAGLQAAVKADPADASGYALLGDAYYQRARETGDPAYYSRAEGSFDAALSRDPNDLTATLGKGTLALARHDFRAGLGLAQRARRLAPDLVRPYAVLADAQIELGRYAAGREVAGAHGRPEADPGRLLADLLLPRAGRRPRRRG